MGILEAFRYDGKRALVVGGATGMGAAAAKAVADLGGEVVVMDYAPVEFPVAKAIQVDLGDRTNIDAALEQVDGPIHAVFSAAGIADGPPLMRVNFIGHRHIHERLIDDGRLGSGGAICLISSVAGLGWQSQLPILLEFLESPSYESADAWVTDHETTNNYMFSKQAMNAYVAYQAMPLMKKGIRINAICPGPTDTPLARANSWLGFAQDWMDTSGAPQLLAEDMGDTMVFLNSDVARGISGVNLLVDNGQVMATIGGSYDAGKPSIDFLMAGTL